MAILWALAFLGGCSEHEPIDACSNDHVGEAAAAIYNGTPQPSFVPLRSGQMLSIGAFDHCSGLLVAPKWVLTAAHCQFAPEERFCVGEVPDKPDVCIDIATVIDHASADLALVELAEEATARLPGIEPIAIMTEAFDTSWLGRTTEASGYGRQEDGTTGQREFTAEPIVEILEDKLTIDGQGKRGLCARDSGGPLLVIAKDGTVRAAGALSKGDGDCIGRDTFTRTDTYRAWIESHTGVTVAGNSWCGFYEKTLGRCDGAAAIFCASGHLVIEQCSHSCGWSVGAGAYRCIEGPDPCGGVDGFGTCDGQVAIRCDAGTRTSRDCAACGQVCAVGIGGGASCVDDVCNGLDYRGRCNGDSVEWCDDGKLKRRDCAQYGQTCAWASSVTGYYCK